MGIIEKEIFRVGKEKYVDLIVMGSYGCYGLVLLLGLIVNVVLYYVEIDVFVVCIKKLK